MPGKEKPEVKLIDYFNRNGCFRIPDKSKIKEQGTQSYKKGYEIRFVLRDDQELKKVKKLLGKAGFKCGKPYSKVSQMVQPVYGKKAQEKFRQFIAGR